MRLRLARTAMPATAVIIVVAAVLVGSPAADASPGAPTVTAVSPTAGPLGGATRVTVTGSNFRHVRSVLFGATAGTSISVLSATKLRVTAPKHAVGTVNIRVRTRAGISPTNSGDRFSYLPRSTVSGLSTSRGRLAGGTTTTLAGTAFSHVTAVIFGASPARSWKRVSGTKIVAISPAHAAGTVDVRVRTAGGISPTSTHDRFTFVPPPSVTLMSPTAGPLTGGDRVTVIGKNFTAVTSVRFGTLAATDVTVLSTTKLQATTPPESAGAVDVRVTGSFGTSAATSADHYSYVAAPSAPSVSAVTAPGPFGPDTTSRPIIQDSACTDSTCYGVGFYETDTADVPIVETLSNGTWTWSVAPKPTDAVVPSAGKLFSIWCGSDSCVAVGAYLNTDGHTLPLIDTFSGGSWTSVSGGHPSTVSEAYYDSIACTTSYQCVASGLAPGGSILATLKSARWSSEFMPVPAGDSVTNVSRASLTCGSASYCVFAGGYSDGTALHAFAETYNGSSWAPKLVPAPDGAAGASILNGVSCPTPTRCVVVGSYQMAGGTTWRPLIGTDDSGSWTTASAPLPADAVAGTGLTRLDAIACSAGHCTAAGQYDGPNGVDGFVNVLDNGMWSAAPVTKAGDSSTTRDFFSTACVTPTECVAVGEDDSTSAHTSGVIALHTPGGNAQAQAPLPDGVTDTDLSLRQVACSASGVCSAIGILSTNPSQWLLITITP